MDEREQEFENLTDHEYDGIREYDNPCPTWWHLVFLGTAVFSVLYILFFMGSMGWTLAEAHESAVARNMELRYGEIGELTADTKTILEYMGKEQWLAVGATTYQMHCKSCHGADGAGLIGPNLTDDNYKHVKELVDLARVVQEGASAGSMPAWKNRLHPNEIVLVAAYVATLRGKNIPGAGDAIEERDGGYREIPPWSTAADADAEADTDSEADPDAEQEGTAETESDEPAEDADDAPADPQN